MEKKELLNFCLLISTSNSKFFIFISYLGITELDKIFKVLLTTNMFVAGVVGCFFDNTIPGSLQERGMIAWKGEMEIKNSNESSNSVREIYNLPFCLSRISEYKFAKYVPFLPFYPKSYDVSSPGSFKTPTNEGDRVNEAFT